MGGKNAYKSPKSLGLNMFSKEQKINSKEYLDNYDKIFRKKDKEVVNNTKDCK